MHQDLSSERVEGDVLSGKDALAVVGLLDGAFSGMQNDRKYLKQLPQFRFIARRRGV